MTNEKHFPKTINQLEFDYGFLTNFHRIIVLANFLPVHSNSKEVSHLYWQSLYPSLKATCNIMLTFLLWIKLPEKLLLAKYLCRCALKYWKSWKSLVIKITERKGWFRNPLFHFPGKFVSFLMTLEWKFYA